MAAAKLNIVLDQGTAWSKRIVWTDANNNAINLTNYWVRMSVKKSYSDANAVIFATTDEPSANGSKIRLTPTNGIIDVTLAAGDITSAISGGLSTGVWDLEVVPPKQAVNFDGVNYTGLTMQVQTSQLLITANNAAAAYDTVFVPANGDRLIVRGSAQDGGVGDGYYSPLVVTATTILCHANGTNTGFSGGTVANPAVTLIKPDNTLAQKIIGGGVSVSKEVTTAEAHTFN